VALDSSDAGFRQQFFHLVFKFLAHQVVVGEADDEDFLDSGHGDAGEDSTKHDARAGEKGKCAEDEDRDERD